MSDAETTNPTSLKSWLADGPKDDDFAASLERDREVSRIGTDVAWLIDQAEARGDVAEVVLAELRQRLPGYLDRLKRTRGGDA